MYFQVSIDSFSKKQLGAKHFLATLSSRRWYLLVFSSSLWSPIWKMHEQVQDTIISVKKYKERWFFIYFLLLLTRVSAQRSWWYYWFVCRPSVNFFLKTLLLLQFLFDHSEFFAWSLYSITQQIHYHCTHCTTDLLPPWQRRLLPRRLCFW